MPVRSAGVLLWRRTAGDSPELLLGHMGGPFWTRKDLGAWSVPKGEYDGTEPPLEAALREFAEELGLAVPVPAEQLVSLGEVVQPSGKRLTVWAGEGDLDPAAVVPGTFTLQWPPRSGRTSEFPELDRVAWWAADDARERVVAGQRPFVDRLVALVGAGR
jgi:predicted NUDIX family NTP pyrophosphohydrolase